MGVNGGLEQPLQGAPSCSVCPYYSSQLAFVLSCANITYYSSEASMSTFIIVLLWSVRESAKGVWGASLIYWNQVKVPEDTGWGEGVMGPRENLTRWQSYIIAYWCFLIFDYCWYCLDDTIVPHSSIHRCMTLDFNLRLYWPKVAQYKSWLLYLQPLKCYILRKDGFLGFYFNNI